MAEIIQFPSANHMPDILETFKKESINLSNIIDFLNTLSGKNLPLAEEELKENVEKLTKVKDSLDEIFEMSQEHLNENYQEVFENLHALTAQIVEVENKLNYVEYSQPTASCSLFTIKIALHRSLNAEDLFHKMAFGSIRESIKPKYH